MYIKWYTRYLPPVLKKLETARNLNLIFMFFTIEWFISVLNFKPVLWPPSSETQCSCEKIVTPS